ncbi:MAG: methylmalonyl-CoA epimerase [Cytophagaceae bacterium]|nr:methylmalonyl-CoA epimerase [Cytophagaceae bacterium]
MKVDHIAIAVKSISQSGSIFEKILNIAAYKEELLETEKVKTSFYKAGETKVELIEPTSADSPISKFLEKKGEGLHHIAFEVSDIKAEMERLKNEGFTLLNEEPKKGADNKLICFLHPKGTNGVLVELCQSI